MKTYLYDDLISSDYYYSFDNDILIIYKNCDNNICTCEKVFTKNDYLRSNEYSCSLTNDNLLDYTIFSSDFYYRNDFVNILIIFFILAFFIIWCPIKIVLRFFKRFN